MKEWRTFPVIERGDTGQQCWTEVRIFYLIVDVEGTMYGVTYTESCSDFVEEYGYPVYRSSAPVWRKVSDEEIVTISEDESSRK